MAKPDKPPAKNLALIGGRGCGKSSVSRRIIAREKRFTLFSLDSLVSYEAGARSIPRIVEQDGWRTFRDIEARVVEKLSSFPEWQLLDCGGGIVVDLDEREREIFSDRKISALRANSLVVYLKRSVPFLEERIEGDQNRPDLSTTESFREIMERRDPWYTEAADFVLDATRLSKAMIVDAVLEYFYKETGVAPLAE